MFTEEQEFLAAANACATALAQNIRTGTAAQSPWPFRVVPDTGEVYAEMEYCADVIDPISLFDSLIDLGQDSSGAYRAARDSAWTWLVSERGPLATENWGNFFEDMGYQFDNSCQINAGDTALYLLSRRESDPQWRAHVDQIIAYMEVHFGEEQYGAMTMNEQDLFRIPMISHTARYAAALAWRKSFGGGVGDQETAFRSLNWSTYGSCPEKNRVFVEIMDAVFGWFTDCHGDYVQHLLSAMAALPEWAPATRPHLLSSSSVIQQAVYGAGYLRYRCFHTGSTETLRTPSKPAAILADGEILGEVSAGDGWTWTPLAAGGVCRIEHAQSRDILVSWLEPPAVAVELRMPSAVFYPGDNCQLNLTVINANSAPAIGLPLAVVLESAGQYWFYPGWTPGVDSVVIEWPPGCAGYRLIAPFAWPPDAGAGSAQFFAALTAPDFSALASDIARWPFAW